MTATTEFITPTPLDSQIAAEAIKRLSAFEPNTIKLQIEVDGKHEYITMPQPVISLLSQILTETANGHSISVVPVDEEITTSEAAEYLNVSRPYLISLLEEGKIPFRKVGTHRRIRLGDVIEYKKQQLARSYAAMAELQEQADELNMEF